MDIKDFKRILAAFSDSQTDYLVTRGEFAAKVRGSNVGGKITLDENGNLFVIENEIIWLASEWVAIRLAHLDLLAERILAEIPEDKNFVAPSGSYLPDLVQSYDSLETNENDIGSVLAKEIKEPLAGTTRVIYLTADAGEGKTTLLHFLARSFAESFIKKESKKLIVPISLGGRHLLRLDDLIVGAVSNRFRFPIYFDSFVELMRMGNIIVALDGFEEMFVETSSGEAVSALGNLLRKLDSAGILIVAARKAYFEYRSLTAQAKFVDSIFGLDVQSSKARISRWDKEKFLEYCTKANVANPEEIYREVSNRLRPDHPLLQRAVLVKRLVELAQDKRSSFLQLLGRAPEDYFDQFVGALLNRELEKWIDRSGDPAGPLMSSNEQLDLLSAVAWEMWIGGATALDAATLNVVAELFCESAGKSPAATRQIEERIVQHALIVEFDKGNSLFCFDHEEFYFYFLGRHIAAQLVKGRPADIKDILRRATLTARLVEMIGHFASKTASDSRNLVSRIAATCEGEPLSSLIRENAGSLCLRLLNGKEGEHIKLAELTFSASAFSGLEISNVTISRSYIQLLDFRDELGGRLGLRAVSIEDSEIERIELDEHSKLDGLKMADISKISSVYVDHEPEFDPEKIEIILEKFGANVIKSLVQLEIPRKQDQEDDEMVKMIEKALRSFSRATSVTDKVFGVRLGKNKEQFFRQVLPIMISKNILEEEPKPGGLRYYRLKVKLSKINDAIKKAGGNFNELMKSF